jgi:prepilin-type N-terminal cleavage/methylation domain-containing protein
MNHKAFTLIELLVVVAIIGILAAVGVVAYNGYTASAKVAAVKNMHSKVVKFVSSELKKCSLDLELKLKTDPNRYTNNLCSDYSKAKLSPGNAANFTYKFMQHFQNGERWRNVYDNSIMTDSCSSPSKEGQLCISFKRDSNGNYLIGVTSQTKAGSGNLLEDNIVLE